MKRNVKNPIEYPIVEITDDDSETSETFDAIDGQYAGYQADVLVRKLDGLKYEIQNVIKTLDARRAEHLRVVEELLRQNQSLKAQLKEKNDA